MPVLENKTKKISIPSIKGSELEVSEKVTWGDLAELDISQDFSVKDGVKLLTKVIKAWNFTDKEGNALPINKDTVGILGTEDVQHIIQEVGLKKGD